MNAFDPFSMNFDPSRLAIVLKEAASEPDQPMVEATSEVSASELEQQRAAGGVFKGKKTKAKAKDE